MTTAGAEFLAQLHVKADERLRAAALVPKSRRCKQCSGKGSVNRYVLPGVVGPDACKMCNGSGRAR